MLTLVLSCDMPGCKARHEIPSYGEPPTPAVEAVGWRWGDHPTLPLRCPEHAGAANDA